MLIRVSFVHTCGHRVSYTLSGTPFIICKKLEDLLKSPCTHCLNKAKA